MRTVTPAPTNGFISCQTIQLLPRGFYDLHTLDREWILFLASSSAAVTFGPCHPGFF